MKPLVLAFVLALVGTPALADAPSPRARRDHRYAKPRAPVDVTLESRAVDGGYQVTLVAVPTRAVPSLELRLDGQRRTFAATRAGQRRELTVRITGTDRDVVGAAVVGGAAVRSRAAILRLGAPAARPADHAVRRTLPNGRVIAEVR